MPDPASRSGGTQYDVYRVTDGKISEEWAGDYIAAIMTQVGVFNPPWAA